MAILATVFFSSCLEEELSGRVIPISDKQSYIVNDTAVTYVITGDTARVQVQFNLDTDTVTGTDIQLVFAHAEQAEDFYQSYSIDPEINDISFNGSFISYSTTNYNGLHQSEIISIIKNKYIFSDQETGSVSETAYSFSPRAITEPVDGMYFILSRPQDDSHTFFWRGCSAKPQTAQGTFKDDKNPWRLIQAHVPVRKAATGRWLIQLSNGRFLRRSGNRLAPLALTTCSDPSQATAWNIEQVIMNFNLWTLHTDITSTSDFYGLMCGKSNVISVGVNALDTYSLLVAPVTLQFEAKDEVVKTIEAPWGSFISLPDAYEANLLDFTGSEKRDDVSDAEETENVTFIGWNTTKNQVEGYLAPGTIVEADNTIYYAVFVKAE